MTRLSKRHPRYESLRTRAGLAHAAREGTVVPEGLIAHGRGEAFDYLLGERTSPSARAAERQAARWIRAARAPVLSVNGNVAALAAREVAELQRAWPRLAVEVNLFHRTPRRARAIAQRLQAAGVSDPLGVRPSARLAGLPSDRAWIDARGIGRADLCIVPLEDGDRALALRRAGIRVVSIDLNPLSRTSRTADLPIVDELRRALRGIASAIPRGTRGADRSASSYLDGARRTMRARLTGRAPPAWPPRAAPRPPRGSARRSGRTPRPSSRRRRSPR